MNHRRNGLRLLALGALLALCTSATAKTVTMGDISLDLPDTFVASESSRGIETKTPDEEVFVWFETYKAGESDALIGEHGKYWGEQQVVPNEPSETKMSEPGRPGIINTDFKQATWKGKPTVVRYSQVGPLGSENAMILVTLWASPEADKSHADEVKRMVDSLTVTYKK